AGAAERRIDIQVIRGDAIGDAARIVIEQVSGDDLEIVVRRVGERAAPIAVAQCPNGGDIGAQLVVDRDITPRVALHAGFFQTEILRIRCAPGGQEDVGSLDLGVAFAFRARDYGAFATRERDTVRVQPNFDSFGLQNLADRMGHVFILARDQARAFLDDGYFA